MTISCLFQGSHVNEATCALCVPVTCNGQKCSCSGNPLPRCDDGIVELKGRGALNSHCTDGRVYLGGPRRKEERTCIQAGREGITRQPHVCRPWRRAQNYGNVCKRKEEQEMTRLLVPATCEDGARPEKLGRVRAVASASPPRGRARLTTQQTYRNLSQGCE